MKIFQGQCWFTYLSHLTLAASSRNRNVMVWRPSVRLSISPVGILTVTHQGAACDAASVHFGPTIKRTDILNCFRRFTTPVCAALYAWTNFKQCCFWVICFLISISSILVDCSCALILLFISYASSDFHRCHTRALV